MNHIVEKLSQQLIKCLMNTGYCRVPVYHSNQFAAMFTDFHVILSCISSFFHFQGYGALTCVSGGGNMSVKWARCGCWFVNSSGSGNDGQDSQKYGWLYACSWNDAIFLSNWIWRRHLDAKHITLEGSCALAHRKNAALFINLLLLHKNAN